MILDDLYRLYELKRESGDVPPVGWTRKRVAWEIGIDQAGNLVSIVPRMQSERKKYVWMDVPLQETRTSGVKPFVLCDKAAYFLGLGAKKDEQKKCRELHHAVFDHLDDPAIKAMLTFLDNVNPEVIPVQLREELGQGKLMVFRYLPDNTLMHERPEVASCWDVYRLGTTSGPSLQCAVSGEQAPAAQLFPQLKGIPGAQSSGAALVSFNNEAFCSYGKTTNEQALNASISAEAAAGIGNALDYLMASSDHRVTLGDTQVLFWTDKEDVEELDEMMLFLNPDDMSEDLGEDNAALQKLQSRLAGIRSGKPAPEIEYKTQYFILGISPNMARLAIRFYETGTLGQLDAHFGQYLRDLELYDGGGRPLRVRSLRAYIYQVAPLGESDKVPASMITSVFSAMVRGRPFPKTLYFQLLERTRIDKGYSKSGKKRYDALSQRAQMLKACLLREARQKGDARLERSLTVALNEENTNVGYLLGRLFAVLEKCQQDALGKNVNATIRDKYIGSASTTPARVFPRLLGLAQHHISKAEYGTRDDRMLQAIMQKMGGAGFPATLSYDDQGQFFIGYYQQKAAFFAKADDSKETE